MKLITKTEFILILITLIASIPLLTIFSNAILIRCIGLLWGMFGWLLAISVIDKEKYKRS